MLKDLNFLEIQKDSNITLVEIAENEAVMESLLKDAKFLASHNVMDYSLLLVVETLKDFSVKRQNTRVTRNKIVSGNKVYHIGLIDYL